MAGRPGATIDFRAFEQPLSPLFRDYLSGEGRAAQFFGGDGRFDLAAVEAAADPAARQPRPREAVAEALVRQQKERGAERAAQNAGRLREPESTAIVTGQQAGLCGGPLFVLWKALGAILVARALEGRRGRPAVPVFWVASDDHDFAEIRSATLIDDTGNVHTLRYSPIREPTGQPASRIVLDSTVTALVEEARTVSRAGLHKDEVIGLLASCYRPGETLGGAFARFLS
jgi:bacillithiol synthase